MIGRLRKLFGLQPAAKDDFWTTPSGGHYEDWRSKRIQAIIDHFTPDFFPNKRILEVGCGYGDIGAALCKQGALLTCSDARIEHLNVVKQRYPDIEVIHADMDSRAALTGHWDMLIHMGLMYHLQDPEAALVDACSLAEHLVLETEVCDSDDPYCVLKLEDLKISGSSQDYDQAFNKIGGRPSAALVERVLKSCGMSFERHFSSGCNSSIHVYDWKPRNDGSWRHGLRRMWFAKRNGT